MSVFTDVTSAAHYEEYDNQLGRLPTTRGGRNTGTMSDLNTVKCLLITFYVAQEFKGQLWKHVKIRRLAQEKFSCAFHALLRVSILLQ